jgi:multidrug resistance efflux pump
VLKAFQVNVLLSAVDNDVMKPGMTARVRVPLTRKEVLVVPRKALVAGPMGTTLVRSEELPDKLQRVDVIDASDDLVVVEGGVIEGERLLPPVSEKQSGVSADTEWLPVERQDLLFSISGTGVLEAERAVDIGPPTLRRVRSFKIVKLAPEGLNVKEGDLLAAFDPSVTLERLSEESANLEKVDEEIERIKASQELEASDLKLQIEDALVQNEKARNKLIQAREFEAFRKVQEATFEAQLAEKRVEFLQNKIQFVERNAQLQRKILEDRQKLHQYRIDQNERALEALTVTAPISGVVIYETDWRNEKKRIGSDVYYQEKFISLPDLETMVVQGQVAEVDAGKLELGQLVNVTLDALPDSSFVGHIDEISSMFTPASTERPVKVLGIKVRLNELDTRIMRPGMVARLQVVIDRFEDVVAVPVSVIQIAEGRSYVWVKNKELLEMRQVEITQDNGVVAIVASGLIEGEEIAGRASEIE